MKIRTGVSVALAVVSLSGLVASLQAQTGTAIAPTIIIHPADQTADYGNNVTLSVEASGVPLHYQWRKNGMNLADYDNAAGARTAQLVLVGVAQRDAADYSVVIGNTAGAVTSAVARVTVNFTTVFSDDFESGALTNWTAFSALPGVANAVRQWSARKTNAIPQRSHRRPPDALNLDGLSPNGSRMSNSPAKNHTPGGSSSAFVAETRNKMYHNLGIKVAGRVKATFWIYDDGDQTTSCYGELRGYTGPGHALYFQPGGLRQLFAIGRFNSGPNDKVTGGLSNKRLNKWTEKPNRTKYQGKVERGKATGSGWFNLNAPGAPDRSVGWHKFEIVRAVDGTNVDFYVDGVLGRHVTGANHFLLDCLTIGSLGADSTPVNAWFDDVKVEAVPWRYDWHSKDTARKGLLDWMQLRETGLDQEVTDIKQISTVFQANGAEASSRLGRWTNENSGLYALDERGSVDYVVQAPADDAYRIEVEGRGRSDKNSPFESHLVVSIDGEYLGRLSLPYDPQTNGFVHCFTPFLNAGPHTIRVYWDGARNYASLYLEAVRLQTLAGKDANHNGIKDWVENRLLAQSGVEVVPETSFVSPVCVEGRGQYLSLMRCEAGGSPDQMQLIPIHPGAGQRWYANVPLFPNGPTSVHIIYQNGSLEESHEIKWRVTNLLEANDLTVRSGDALLLTAVPPTGTEGEVKIAVIGVTNYVTDTATPIPHRFDKPGTFIVTGTFDGSTKVARTVTVKVVAATFDGPVAAWVAHRRYWDCTNLPPEVVLDADPRLQIVEVPESVRQTLNPAPPPLGNNGRGYRLAIDAAEPRIVLARLGTNGPVLASTVIEGFRLFSTYDTYLRYVHFYRDRSQLIEGAFILSPREIVSTGITVDLSIFVSGSTFEDGTLTKTLVPSNFDELGICRVKFVRAAKVKTTVCHTTRAYQRGVALGRPGYEK
jgi:hypothetical protein